MTNLARMFCVIDIESTGGAYGKESIMEIAAFRYDGNEVVDQLISLVHPHKKIQHFVSKMTGINEKMLVRAPRFHEIAKRLVEITQDAVIVGHNVDFDYRMLRQEFQLLGYHFERNTLDTIKLAEKLIPDLKSYGLDAVCDGLGIYRNNKHRAESDARATLELFEILREKDLEKGINVVEQGLKKNDFFKDKMLDLQRAVKHNKGVYYMHNRNGNLLYLGASDNVKTALNRLFMADSNLAKALSKETHSINVEPCGNWLIARIKRHEELKKVKPKYNSTTEVNLAYVVLADKRSNPPKYKVEELSAKNESKALMKLENDKAAYRAIRMHGKNTSKEERMEAFRLLEKFPHSAIFYGKGRESSEKSVFYVHGGLLKGYTYVKLNQQTDDLKKLKNNLVEITEQELFTDLLKLGYMSSEFKLQKLIKPQTQGVS